MDIKELNVLKIDFEKILENDVIPFLKNEDKIRNKERIKIYTICLAILLFFVALIILFCSYESEQNNKYAIIGFFSIFGLCLSNVAYKGLTKKYEMNLKKKIMPTIIKAFGNFDWYDVASISTSTIHNINLVPYFNKYNIDDNFIGEYKGIKINISEMELMYETTDSDGNQTTQIVFNGIFVMLDSNKKFNGHTLIKKRKVINNKIYEEVKLEDPLFSKKYYVESSDQIEARYLLTTAFMERYKNLEIAFSSDTIEACFKNNKLFLAIPSQKDLFTIGNINKSLYDIKQFRTFFNEIISLIDVIEVLKLV